MESRHPDDLRLPITLTDLSQPIGNGISFSFGAKALCRTYPCQDSHVSMPEWSATRTRPGEKSASSRETSVAVSLAHSQKSQRYLSADRRAPPLSVVGQVQISPPNALERRSAATVGGIWLTGTTAHVGTLQAWPESMIRFPALPCYHVLPPWQDMPILAGQQQRRA